MKVSGIVSLGLVLCLPSAQANDSLASIDGGNVVFEKTADISMNSEELEISPGNVFVEYQFRNLTNQPIDRTLTFLLTKMDSEVPYDVQVDNWLKGKDPLAFQLMKMGKANQSVLLQKKKIWT